MIHPPALPTEAASAPMGPSVSGTGWVCHAWRSELGVTAESDIGPDSCGRSLQVAACSLLAKETRKLQILSRGPGLGF